MFFPVLGSAPRRTQGFTPASISGLQLWLRADAGVYSDAGTTPAVNDDGVRQWNDQSGNNNHASMSTAGSRPTFKTSVQNQQPGLLFDGTSDYMDLTGMSVASGNKTAFFAVNPTSSTTGKFLFDAQTGRLIFAHTANDTTTNVGYFDGAWRTDGAASNGFQVLTFNLASSSSGSISRNDSALATGLNYTQRAIGGNVALGGSNDGSGAYFPGYMHEVILYNSALSESDQANVYSYLRTRWASSNTGMAIGLLLTITYS